MEETECKNMDSYVELYFNAGECGHIRKIWCDTPIISLEDGHLVIRDDVNVVAIHAPGHWHVATVKKTTGS